MAISIKTYEVEREKYEKKKHQVSFVSNAVSFLLTVYGLASIVTSPDPNAEVMGIIIWGPLIAGVNLGRIIVMILLGADTGTVQLPKDTTPEAAAIVYKIRRGIILVSLTLFCVIMLGFSVLMFFVRANAGASYSWSF